MSSPLRTALIVVVVLAAIVGSFGFWWMMHTPVPEPVAPDRFAARENPVDGKRPSGRFMFNVTLHTPEEIQGMLQRAEELAARGQPVRPETGIALVLHGPEIRLFTKQSYEANRALIELARRLDREGIIEIKMCRTAMRDLRVNESDVPDFIGFVPYAPDEIKRLEGEGYVYL